ncbi:TIGR03086 family metal-binding protein [Gordonia alkaliphila]|uniref:TIGR03086 family metal-binding protein n=1 Tax=Gordonia alkaliphila TaxID=1053547 RepID=UPI001FF54A0E|nr:TIGR03086 family metal-binding protein [Gordonia alkaliphila]MCK0439697.1 TIGR03086 family metal-binding protein [Gordonia alkaliphila]
MAWDALDLYTHGLDFFSEVVDAVPVDSWNRASPCAGWTGRDVLGHVGAGTEMGIAILSGKPMTYEAVDPPGSVVPDDPAAWWRDLAAAARTALATVEDLDRVVESPAGPRSVRDGLSFPGVDLFLHGWDLAAATGQKVELPAEAIAFTEQMFTHIPDEVSRQPGVFGPALEAPADASATDRLLSFTGRDPSF